MSSAFNKVTNSVIDCVIFDLGGVLIELAGPPLSPKHSQMSEPEIWQQWLGSSAVRLFESGQSSQGEFAAALIKEMEIDQTPDSFLSYFKQWPVGFYAEVESLLGDLKNRVHLACLSNTNLLHWERFSQETTVIGQFDFVFASFKTGLLKPDLAAFEHAIAELDMRPERLLFFDDNSANVQSARSAGMRAELTRGPIEAATHLKRYGLL
jgi:HAD superfamily hydrolase (TIGR01509 family)